MMSEFIYTMLAISLCINALLFRANLKMNREIGIAAGIIIKERRSRDIEVKKKVIKTILNPN